MKKILFLISLLVTLCAHAQIKFTDSIRHFTASVYAGTLGGPSISLDHAKIGGFITLRAGGDIAWNPIPNIRFMMLGAGEINEKGVITPFALAEAKFFMFKQHLAITVGKIATPMTEIRPLPTTGSGQFESWSEARIPGSAVGGKISYSFQKASITAGGFWRLNDASVELGFKVKHFQIGGYYLIRSQVFGTACRVSYDRLTEVLAYNYKGAIASLTVVKISKKHSISVYSDVGIGTDVWKLSRGEWGILKGFSIKSLQILTGVGYAQEIKSFKAYCYIHL